MSRKPRQYTRGKLLHVIVRGIGRQILFENHADYMYYLSLLRKYKQETAMDIIAYCLMENHVHMLLQDHDGNTALFMKKTGISYAAYYNKKYERTGHLFQDRYISQVIEDERGLLNVFQYILLNPEKAGISMFASYRWSSYQEYGNRKQLSNSKIIEDLLGSRDQLDNLLRGTSDLQHMEPGSRHRDDSWAQAVLHHVLDVKNGVSLQKMAKHDRDDVIRSLRRAGLSIRQIERLTGISRGVIQRLRQ